jgi:hypothetical protein
MGKWSDEGWLSEGFAMLMVVVLAAVILQLLFLKPSRITRSD